MNKILSSLLATALFGIGLIAAIPHQYEKEAMPHFGGSRANCTTVGTNCACNHLTVPVQVDAITYLIDFTGSMTLGCLDTGTTLGGYFWRKLTPTGFDVYGTSPTLGSIHVYLDASRPQTISYMESLNTINEFPAQHDVYAYAKMTMSARPGKTYRSITPFQMHASSISSFGTGSQESYSVVSNVDFEDPGAGIGGTWITVMAAPITINP